MPNKNIQCSDLETETSLNCIQAIKLVIDFKSPHCMFILWCPVQAQMCPHRDSWLYIRRLYLQIVSEQVSRWLTPARGAASQGEMGRGDLQLPGIASPRPPPRPALTRHVTASVPVTRGQCCLDTGVTWGWGHWPLPLHIQWSSCTHSSGCLCGRPSNKSPHEGS